MLQRLLPMVADMDLKKSDFEWAQMPISGTAKILEIGYFNQFNNSNLVVVAIGTIEQPTGHWYESGNKIYRYIADEFYRVRNVRILLCEESSTQTSFACVNLIKRVSTNDEVDFSFKSLQASYALKSKGFDVLKDFAIQHADLHFSMHLDGEILYKELVAKKDYEEPLLLLDPTYFDLRMLKNDN